MASNSNPKSIIEELKAAGEELKEIPKQATPLNFTRKKSEAFASGRIKIGDYQKELSGEQTVLEKTHQKVKQLERRLEERIEFLKKLQTKGLEINKGLEEFEEQLALARKENGSLFEQIKSELTNLEENFNNNNE